MVLVVVLRVLEAVVELVTVIVHSSIVKVIVVCHVVILRVLEDQPLSVTVLNVIPVVVVLVEETVKLVVQDIVILMDVIHHVIIGV